MNEYSLAKVQLVFFVTSRKLFIFVLLKISKSINNE